MEMVDGREPYIFISLFLVGDAPPPFSTEDELPASSREWRGRDTSLLSEISRLVSSHRLSVPDEKSLKNRPAVD